MTRDFSSKCKNCGRQRGSHKSKTLNCPFGSREWPSFYKDQFFEPTVKRKRASKKDVGGE